MRTKVLARLIYICGGRRRGQQKSCFKSAENWAASSLWIGGHRYTGIKFVSKLVWVYSDLKLGHHFGQFSIPKRFTKELVLRQNLPLQFFFGPGVDLYQN